MKTGYNVYRFNPNEFCNHANWSLVGWSANYKGAKALQAAYKKPTIIMTIGSTGR